MRVPRVSPLSKWFVLRNGPCQLEAIHYKRFEGFIEFLVPFRFSFKKLILELC